MSPSGRWWGSSRGIDRIRRTWAGQDAQGEGEGGSEDRISPRLLEGADGVQEAPCTEGTLESRAGHCVGFPELP